MEENARKDKKIRMIRFSLLVGLIIIAAAIAIWTRQERLWKILTSLTASNDLTELHVVDRVAIFNPIFRAIFWRT